mmetsp:Transcript_43674/g.109011  ORF Transcript_43674/g.109011 Transcript_43674/m.109011 type:complete len:253 (+) Transcript_43674:217-975(+)
MYALTVRLTLVKQTCTSLLMDEWTDGRTFSWFAWFFFFCWLRCCICICTAGRTNSVTPHAPRQATLIQLTPTSISPQESRLIPCLFLLVSHDSLPQPRHKVCLRPPLEHPLHPAYVSTHPLTVVGSRRLMCLCVGRDDVGHLLDTRLDSCAHVESEGGTGWQRPFAHEHHAAIGGLTHIGHMDEVASCRTITKNRHRLPLSLESPEYGDQRAALPLAIHQEDPQPHRRHALMLAEVLTVLLSHKLGQRIRRP